ncbi:uncharacterized protein EAF01_000781 [Botrytis porri]|uniref:Mid2 domain-containing protein n=1 Tax=Botrytis porri TaxID=87229 RepID=A0A4Z1KVK6_9HELO|nr:uncharacterized protein EAF01_000781 [Botrytis porri]KAF7914375.1 hypothetical protein EAF01_000781 [Botrytis porri]TGO88584.1 hypothetical protein BPOR_0153g00040 [Botrytis porri]
MLIRQIIALATALLVQAPVALSDDSVGHHPMQNGIQVLNQEQVNESQGKLQQAQSQQCQIQNRQMQGQQSQCQPSTQIYQSQPTGGQERRGLQLQARQSQASQNQRIQPLSTNTGGSGQCFLSNGSCDPNGIPCFSSDSASRCCGSDEFCSTNKLCVSKNDSNKFSRGSCTDPTFRAASCPNICQNIGDTGAVLPCGDPSLGRFCCDEGRGFECCSTLRKVFTLGRGTTFTENSANSAATANSDTDFQPQRSSQSATTRTETETATQIQTQISSATQIVVSTSVSVSVQVITSNQSPTSTIAFSPAVSITSSTSIILITQTTSQNQNSQPLSSSTIWNANTRTSATSSSNGDQSQNGGTSSTTSANSQASSKSQTQNQTDNQDIQSTVSNFLKSPNNMTAIIAGSSALVAIVILGISIVCFRKRRRSKKSGIQLQDGKRRGSASERGASEKMGKIDEDGNGNGKGDTSIGVFVTVSEKLRGFKKKAHTAHLKEDDRVSREFDGALGGGMYLEGGTMGRGRPRGDLGRSSAGSEYMSTRDMSTNSNNPPPIPSSFSNPRTPPQPPSLPPFLPSQSLDSEYRTSRGSFTSATTGSHYSRATNGDPLRIPLQIDMPVPYRPVASGNGGAYGLLSREEEQGSGLGRERTNDQRQEEPRGFF